MRLTLRTLLAYRDGVLSPADHEDLHRRIQQSPDAGNLLRRIQELIEGSAILTPKLNGAGLADTNVIADYLDDVLTTNRVAELERLCLEYSEHLCELAHCHQMLAQAVHTHVEIPESLRQTAVQLSDPAQREAIQAKLLTRSRKLAKQSLAAADKMPLMPPVEPPLLQAVSQTASSELHANVTSPAATTAGVLNVQAGLDLEQTSLSTEVPEYLLGSRKLRWGIPAAILALSACLILLVWQSIGSLDSLQQLLRAEPDGVRVAQQSSNTIANSADSELPIQAGQAGKPSPASDSHGNQSVIVAQATIDPTTKIDKPEIDHASDAELAAVGPSVELPVVAGVGAANGSVGTADANSPQLPLDDTAGDSVESDPVSKVNEAGEIFGLKMQPVDDHERNSVLLLVSDASVKLLATEDHGLSSGKLVIPPVARTTLEIGSWKWLTVGPGISQFELQPNRLNIRSSMLRGLFSQTTAQNALVLQTPLGEIEVELFDSAAWIWIEINYRAVGKGSLTQSDTYAPVVVLVAGSEGATASPVLMSVKSLADGNTIKIDSPAKGIAITKAGQMEEFAMQTPPTWYRKESVRAIDQLGMADFRSQLQSSSEPLNVQLRNLARDRRPEVASLAIQTALLLDDWQPWATELLSSDRFRSHWGANLELAKQWIVANPDSVNSLQLELQSKWGAEADRLLALLVGLTREQQNADGFNQLVKGLDANHPLPVRILAFDELKRLTGDEMAYQPHAPLRSSVQQWRARLAGNKIGLLTVSDPIIERNAR